MTATVSRLTASPTHESYRTEHMSKSPAKIETDPETGCVVQQHSRRSVTTWNPEMSGVKASTLSVSQQGRYNKDIRLQVATAADNRGNVEALTVWLLTFDEAEGVIDVLDSLLTALEKLRNTPAGSSVSPRTRGQQDFLDTNGAA